MKHLIDINTFLINESRSRYDGLASKLTKNAFKVWIADFKKGKKSSTYYDQVELNDLEFDYTATIYFDSVEGTKIKGFEILGSTGADARDFYDDDEGDEVDQTPFIHVDFAIESDWLPGYWQDVYMYLADCTRHEMEHITQGGESIGNYRPGKPNEDDQLIRDLIKAGYLPEVQYLLLPKEVDANLQGLRYEAKKRREPIIDAINRYLDIKNLSEEERETVMKAWRHRAKKIGGIPKF